MTTNDCIPTIDVFIDKFRSLSPEEQASLLGKLENVRLRDTPVSEIRPGNSINDLFGAWDFDEPPEETVRKIREARCFTRKRESL